jgi:Fe-S oxidoreductase
VAETPTRKRSWAERLVDVPPEALKTAIQTLADIIDAQSADGLESCVRCGLCAESCHYFLADRDLRSIPAYKLNLIIRVFRRQIAGSGRPRRLAPGLDAATIREWADALYGRCTLCGRCMLNCTMGIQIPAIIRKGRAVLASLGLIPDGLESTVAMARETGNNMGITREDWVETAAWLQDDLRAETGDPRILMPMDKEGADFLYAVNPREPKFYPLTLTAAAKLFHASGRSWTLSSRAFDVTNYAYFTGDDALAALFAGRLREAMDELNVKTLVLSECGHGFASNRWEAASWLAEKLGREVKSVLEIVAEDLREGRIRLDPDRNPKTVTLHDPCQLVRMGGVIEEQRDILKRSVRRFVEMTPNRKDNYCCGGGGGQLSMSEFAPRRKSAGRIKADQIARTKAQVVASPCHNCLDQLAELNKHYKLGVEVKSVLELAAEALLPSPG